MQISKEDPSHEEVKQLRQPPEVGDGHDISSLDGAPNRVG